MVPVTMTYPFGMSISLADRLFGTTFNGFARRILLAVGNLRHLDFGVPVVVDREHLGAQRRAHAVTTTPAGAAGRTTDLGCSSLPSL